MVRLYLDACCLNRPFDDQCQTRVRLEAEAVLAILAAVAAGDWTLLSSSALTLELERTPDSRRRARTQKYLSLAREYFTAGPAQSARVKYLQVAGVLRALDALHLACAENLRADVFLTTDDRLLRGGRRLASAGLAFVVYNPLAWLTEFLSDR